MKTERILGIDFANEPIEQVIDASLATGGLMVVPSGPGLAVDLKRSDAYRDAVTRADYAIADSGAMVLFRKLFARRSVERISGLKFLQYLLARDDLKAPGATFWVHPSTEQQSLNEAWLRAQGFSISEHDAAIAPFYGPGEIHDPQLIDAIRARQPKVVILCIGGGVQERLGWSIRQALANDPETPLPLILCTGAAIGFLSGNQVNIPTWADRAMLGWLFRCCSEPRKFIPRYLSALPLATAIARDARSVRREELEVRSEK